MGDIYSSVGRIPEATGRACNKYGLLAPQHTLHQYHETSRNIFAPCSAFTYFRRRYLFRVRLVFYLEIAHFCFSCFYGYITK